MEHFIRAAAELALTGSHSMEAVLAVAAPNGIEMLGPLPEVR